MYTVFAGLRNTVLKESLNFAESYIKRKAFKGSLCSTCESSLYIYQTVLCLQQGVYFLSVEFIGE